MDPLHLHAMLHQASCLRSCFASADPWRLLVERHPLLLDIVDVLSRREQRHPQLVRAQLMNVYQRYAEEWQQVQQLFQHEPAETGRFFVAAL